MERVRPISPHLQLDTRTMRGRVDSRTWNLPDDLSEDAGIVLAKIGAGMMWWVGDYWIYGDKKYGCRKGLLSSRSFCTPAAPRELNHGPFQWPFKCGRATSIKSSMV